MFNRLMLILLLYAYSALACADTAAEMLPGCQSVVNATLVTADGIQLPAHQSAYECWGAFATLQQAIATTRDRVSILRVCAPEKSTRPQLIAIFVKYANDHPEQLHERFFDVALAALRGAFPCPSPK